MSEGPFVTAVDPRDPLKGNHTLWRLDVYYDIDDEQEIGEQLSRLDGAAQEIAAEWDGVIAGSGCGSGVRDIELHFATEHEMVNAKASLRDAGFRFFCHAECCGGSQ